MNISLNCKLSLSKKLRALLGREATLTLVSQDIVDGKGTAILSLETNKEELKDINIESLGETSIMLIPVEQAEETPNSGSKTFSSIFVGELDKHNPVTKKIAATNPPEKGEEKISIKEKVEIPKAFKQLKNEECQEYIKNLEELIGAANLSKSKQSSIDTSVAQNDREKAVLMELKEKEEAIDIPAWIVNDKVGMLSVNDLNISLPLNAPYDLSNISAKRILTSKDLKGLLKAGYIKFISPSQKKQYIEKNIEAENRNHGLEVFSNHEEAMDNMGADRDTRHNPIIDEENSMTISESDIDKPTEEESEIINLTQNLPKIRTNAPVEKQTQHNIRPPSGVKTISRK